VGTHVSARHQGRGSAPLKDIKLHHTLLFAYVVCVDRVSCSYSSDDKQQDNFRTSPILVPSTWQCYCKHKKI